MARVFVFKVFVLRLSLIYDQELLNECPNGQKLKHGFFFREHFSEILQSLHYDNLLKLYIFI